MVACAAVWRPAAEGSSNRAHHPRFHDAPGARPLQGLAARAATARNRSDPSDLRNSCRYPACPGSSPIRGTPGPRGSGPERAEGVGTWLAESPVSIAASQSVEFIAQPHERWGFVFFVYSREVPVLGFRLDTRFLPVQESGRDEGIGNRRMRAPIPTSRFLLVDKRGVLESRGPHTGSAGFSEGHGRIERPVRLNERPELCRWEGGRLLVDCGAGSA